MTTEFIVLYPHTQIQVEFRTWAFLPTLLEPILHQ